MKKEKATSAFFSQHLPYKAMIAQKKLDKKRKMFYDH